VITGQSVRARLRGRERNGQRPASNPAPQNMDHDDAGNTRELYSNHFRIGFNVAEFLLDFGRNFDGDERFYQRVITAPIHAKELSRLLHESVRSYEQKFGLIAGDDEVNE
jgi:hypothetical protein